VDESVPVVSAPEAVSPVESGDAIDLCTQIQASEELVPEAPSETHDLIYIEIVRQTRTCVQYGIFGFAVLCILIGAVEAMFGR
jgi:hypothetical protein